MDILVFLLILEIIGFLAFPIVQTIAGNLRDTGYSLARPLGIIIVSLVVCLLSSLRLAPFTASSYIGLILLAALAAFIIYRHRWIPRMNRDLFLQEALFISTFFLAAIFLMHNPEIFFGYSENFMNAAYFHSVLQTDFLPLIDPWFAGYNLPYYYLGHLASAILVLVSGIEAVVGYNLAVAAFFAMGVQTAFGVGLNLTGQRLYGFCAATLTMLSGFPAGFVQLLSYMSGIDLLQFQTFQGSFPEWLTSFDFTAATRIIPDSIVFYPFFTFLQGDLHAHFMSIPFLLALIGLCLAFYRQFSWTAFAAALVVTAFLAGVNAWTLPVSLILCLGTAYLATEKRFFLYIIGLLGCIFAVSLLVGLIGVVDFGQKTDLAGFFLIFSVFAIISLAYLFETHELLHMRPHTISQKHIIVAVAIIAIAIIGFFMQFPLVIISVFALLFLYHGCFNKEYASFLAGISLLMILFCELFFINDPYSPPYERMNTIMKLYLQVWIFWGLAATYFLFRIRSKIVVAGTIVLIGIAAIHPMGSIMSMPNADFLGETRILTLDGSQWIKEQKYDEYAALCWLKETVKGGEVVLEAPGEAYTYSSRISAFTGLPTVIGWTSHARMRGREWEEIEQRSADIDSIYTKCPPELLAKYNIRYIIVGETERKRYGTDLVTLEKCEGMKQVFRSGSIKIYQVDEFQGNQ